MHDARGARRTRNAVRVASVDDADLVAALHAASWKASYAGILPARYLSHEVDEERRRYWVEALETERYWSVLLVGPFDAPMAFLALALASESGYDATIEHLHVRPGHRGSRLGRRLMGEAADRLAGAGMRSVCLRVFEANRAAIRFYQRLGGVTDQTGVDRLAGGAAPDRRIGWHDLAALRAACRRSASG